MVLDYTLYAIDSYVFGFVCILLCYWLMVFCTSRIKDYVCACVCACLRACVARIKYKINYGKPIVLNIGFVSDVLITNIKSVRTNASIFSENVPKTFRKYI